MVTFPPAPLLSRERRQQDVDFPSRCEWDEQVEFGAVNEGSLDGKGSLHPARAILAAGASIGWQ